MKRILFLLITIILFSNKTIAQCAMCKAVVENNDENMGSNINYGIIFMIVAVYIILFLFFRKKIKKFFSEMKNIYN